jgi:hypothetical protein
MAIGPDDVLTMLRGYRERGGDPGADGVDSLELVWLIHQVEQRYGVRLDLTDGQLSSMSTVDQAAAVLSAVLAGATATTGPGG